MEKQSVVKKLRKLILKKEKKEKIEANVMGSIRGFAGYGAKNVHQMSCLGSKHPEKLTLFYRDGVLIT